MTVTVARPSTEADHGLLRDLTSAYARSTPVRKVAVVGNAPMRPSRKRATEIDSADLVIRVNSFVLDRPDSEPCQGSRVDVVLWNRITRATEFLYADYRDRLFLMAEPMRMYGNPEEWPTSWPEDLGLVALPNRSVAMPLCERLGVPWRDERIAPTTGLTAAYLAVTLYPDADVVLSGFSFLDDPTQTSWRHQWGDECPVGREHRIDSEAELMRSWLVGGQARLVR